MYWEISIIRDTQFHVMPAWDTVGGQRVGCESDYGNKRALATQYEQNPIVYTIAIVGGVRRFTSDNCSMTNYLSSSTRLTHLCGAGAEASRPCKRRSTFSGRTSYSQRTTTSFQSPRYRRFTLPALIDMGPCKDVAVQSITSGVRGQPIPFLPWQDVHGSVRTDPSNDCLC